LRAALALLLAALPAAAQEAGWERLLPGFANAMAACLRDRPGGMVIEARLPAGARMEAVTLLPDGRQELCVLDLMLGRVVTRGPLRPEHEQPGPHLRAFMLERRCVDARRVEDADGREVGWLAYPGCG
jgi:hypothetical protein